MPEPDLQEAVLDTVAIRVLAFAHPRGMEIGFQGLAVSLLRLPADVYNRDEIFVSIDDDDRHLSELARGLRIARRQINASVADVRRYESWLTNAAQMTE